jgi:amino acid permease
MLNFAFHFFVGYGGMAYRLLFLVAFGFCSALGYRLNCEAITNTAKNKNAVSNSCRAFLKS